MKNHEFSVSDLDDLINEITDEQGILPQKPENTQPTDVDIDDLMSVERGPRRESIQKVEAETPMKSVSQLDPTTVYQQLSELVSLGNQFLKTAQYAFDCDPTAEGAAAGTASLLNSVTDVTKEFAKIHLMNLKHAQSMELENHRQRNREALLKLKQGGMKQVEELVPYCQEDVIKSFKARQV
jgi:hypothetical protein